MEWSEVWHEGASIMVLDVSRESIFLEREGRDDVRRLAFALLRVEKAKSFRWGSIDLTSRLKASRFIS